MDDFLLGIQYCAMAGVYVSGGVIAWAIAYKLICLMYGTKPIAGPDTGAPEGSLKGIDYAAIQREIDRESV